MFSTEISEELLRLSKIFQCKVYGLSADIRYEKSYGQTRYSEFETDGYWLSFENRKGVKSLSLYTNPFGDDDSLSIAMFQRSATGSSALIKNPPFLIINGTSAIKYEQLNINSRLTKEKYFEYALMNNCDLSYDVIKMAIDCKEKLQNEGKFILFNYELDLDKLKRTILK